MSITYNNLAVRASILSFLALSFSTPLFGAGTNGSDSAVQSIVSPVIPSWIEIPVLVTTAFVAAPAAPTVPAAPAAPTVPAAPKAPTAPAAPPTPLKPGDPGYIESHKDLVVAPPTAPEAEYLPPKSARN